VRLRKYAVTVMDNWTAMRTFWTYEGARKFWLAHSAVAYLYRWSDGKWVLWEPPF